MRPVMRETFREREAAVDKKRRFEFIRTWKGTDNEKAAALAVANK